VPLKSSHTEYVRALDLGGGIGGIIYQKKGSDYYYYHYNHKGDVVALTDGSAKLAAYYEHYAWGTVMTQAEKSGVDNPYRYSTKEWDEKSGLYYFGARYYSPEIGRWTQRDALGEVDGLNFYAYASNQPVFRVDPWGLKVTVADIRKAMCLLKEMGLASDASFRWVYVTPGFTFGGEGFTVRYVRPYGVRWTVYINLWGIGDPESVAQTILHELGHVEWGPMFDPPFDFLNIYPGTHEDWEREADRLFRTTRDRMSIFWTSETCCHPNKRRYYLTQYGAALKRCGIGDCVRWVNARYPGKKARPVE